MSENYLVQNRDAGFVGNNPMFWREGGSGYTSYIDNAERFTKEAAFKLVRHDPHKWAAWRASDVESCAYRTCEWQELCRLKPASIDELTPVPPTPVVEEAN